MHKNKPLVSIIMPAFNADKYIKSAINSVMNQSLQNWELIVINDGSTDKTSINIKFFSDNRIVLLEQENKGVSSARNLGLDKATGEFITFLDADDILPKNSIQARSNYLRNNPSVDVVDGIVNVKNSEMIHNIRIYKPYYHGLLLPKLVSLDSSVFFGVCYMFKKSILSNIKFNIEMTHAEDLLFYIELASKGNLIYGFVDEDVYYYRTGNNSAMMNLDGLEDGYFKLLKNINHFDTISKQQMFLLRLRIAKILFLTRFRHKNYSKSISCLLKALFIR